MYTLTRRSTFKEESLEKSSSLESIKESLESARLLTKHLGFMIKEVEDGFDVVSNGERNVTISHYRIVEDGE